jgi:hypothetical protein
MSFLKFKQSRKLKDHTREQNGKFIPMETLDLQSSISAVSHNIVLSCKNCVADSNAEGNNDNDGYHNFSGLVGVISKDCFMIYQIHMKLNQEFTSKNVLNLHTPHSTNYPTIRSRITEVSEA